MRLIRRPVPISAVSSDCEIGEYCVLEAPEEDLLGKAKAKSTFRRGESGEMMCSCDPGGEVDVRG